MEPRFAGDVLDHDCVNAGLVGYRDMEGANLPGTFHKAYDGTLASRAGLAALGVGAALALRGRTRDSHLAVIGLIDLHDLAFTAKRGKAASAHRLADAVSHEPSG